MARVKILLADDHTLFCDLLRELLQPEYEVVGIVSDGRALLKAAEALRPDVVLLDIGMPSLNGLDAGRRLNSETSHLLEAIRRALRGVSYVAPEIRRAMKEIFIRNPKAVERPQHLTDRQKEVLQMLAEGRSLREISTSLQISYRTVRFHKVRIMEELGISKNAELVKYAITHGLTSTV